MSPTKDVNASSRTNAAMKTFKVIPVVLAGLCGYLHTTINRKFQDLGDIITDQPSNALIHLPQHGSTMTRGDSMSTGRATSTTHHLMHNSNHNNMGTNGHSQLLLSSSDMTMDRDSILRARERRRNYDVRQMRGPATDIEEQGREFPFEALATTQTWTPPLDTKRIPAHSEEYQEELLQYTLNLLPNHRDPTAAVNTENEEILQPKAYDYNQIDIIVPASGQDERLRTFAKRLGVALSNFNQWYKNERRPAIVRRLKQEEDRQGKINPADGEEDGSKPNDAEKPLSGSTDSDKNLDLQFRLLVTRYPLDAQKTEADFRAFHQELSQLTTLPLEQIEIVRVGQNNFIQDEDVDVDNTMDQPDDEHDQSPQLFNRANARNTLSAAACQTDDCILTAMDVDMQVLPIFFHNALTQVKPFIQSYFPVVFSEYNPTTVQVVQDFLYSAKLQNNVNQLEEDDSLSRLPPYSSHRGLWRDFGFGMYALAGSDVQRFQFNEEYEGWGHEDTDFYKLVKGSMTVHRQHEHGLIHGWHPKNCDVGADIVTQEQWIDCTRSRDAMEGDPLGLLLQAPLPTLTIEDFPGKPGESYELDVTRMHKQGSTEGEDNGDEDAADGNGKDGDDKDGDDADNGDEDVTDDADNRDGIINNPGDDNGNEDTADGADRADEPEEIPRAATTRVSGQRRSQKIGGMRRRRGQ